MTSSSCNVIVLFIAGNITMHYIATLSFGAMHGPNVALKVGHKFVLKQNSKALNENFHINYGKKAQSLPKIFRWLIAPIIMESMAFNLNELTISTQTVR